MTEEQVHQLLLKMYYENFPGCKLEELKEKKEGYHTKELIDIMQYGDRLQMNCTFSWNLLKST